MDLVVGMQIAGRYRLESPIGEGGFGTVWLATQLGVDRPVAIKFLKPGQRDAQPRKRFEREAKALGRLSHPGCVTVHDFGELEDGQFYLVTEYLRGETLQSLLGGVAWVDVVDIGRQLALALEHAHRNGVVHRDLKPANIMLVPGDGGRVVVKMLDFGVARSIGPGWPDVTKTGMVVGTPGYMSPEQLLGDEPTGATDQYSLGVLLFEMVEGQAPFRAESPLMLAARHIRDPPPPLTTAVPESLRTVIYKLLEKNPEDRYPTARAVADALSDVRESPARPPPVPASTDTVSAVLKPSPSAPTSGVLPLLVGGTLVLAVGAAMLLLKPAQEEPLVSSNRIKNALSSAAKPTVSRPAEPDAGAADSGPDLPALYPRWASAGCGGKPRTAGRVAVTEFTAGLEQTEVMAHIPRGYSPDTPHPMVLLLHDTLQTTQTLLSGTGFPALADRDGVIIVTPTDGLMNQSAWSHDGGYVAAIRGLELAQRQLCVDLDRIAVVGHGVGGGAAEQLICELPHVNAIVTSGHRLRYDEQPCREKPPVPYLYLAGLKDGMEPVKGGEDCFGKPTRPLEWHEDTFQRLHGCSGGRRTFFEHEASTCFDWACDVPFVSCHLDGGRPWPKMPTRVECEGRPADFPQSEMAWSFLMHHLRRARSTGSKRWVF